MRRVPFASFVLVALFVFGGRLSAQEPGVRPSPTAVSGDEALQANAAAASQTTDGGAKGFFVALGRDLKHLPSIETALTLGIGGGLALGAHPADKRLTQDAVSTESLEETLDAGDVIGNGWTQIGGAVGTLILGHLNDSPRVQALGSDLLRAQILNAAFTQGIKHAVNRPRPDGSNYSFPSGHASASFASAAVIERHFGWKVGLAAYAVAAYAGTSRLSENKHYASDVIFGSALGLVSGHTVTVGHGPNRFAVMPIAMPGGIAVSVSTSTKP
jgi:hypothetical protein